MEGGDGGRGTGDDAGCKRWVQEGRSNPVTREGNTKLRRDNKGHETLMRRGSNSNSSELSGEGVTVLS